MDQSTLLDFLKQMMDSESDDGIPKYIRLENDENMKTYLTGMSKIYGIGGGLRRKQVNKLLEQLCDRKIPAALASYGNRLYHGMGMHQDKEEGVRMLIEASEAGYDYATELISRIFSSEEDSSEVEVLELHDESE